MKTPWLNALLVFTGYAVAVYCFFHAVFSDVRIAWLIPINLVTGFGNLYFVVKEQEKP